MKRDTKDAIAFPVAMIAVLVSVYLFVKFIRNMPTPTSDEGLLGEMFVLGFVFVPLFFGLVIGIVCLCMWSSTDDKS